MISKPYCPSCGQPLLFTFRFEHPPCERVTCIGRYECSCGYATQEIIGGSPAVKRACYVTFMRNPLLRPLRNPDDWAGVYIEFRGQEPYWINLERNGCMWRRVRYHNSVLPYEPLDLPNITYGVTWRCWVDEPTKEEREDAPWIKRRFIVKPVPKGVKWETIWTARNEARRWDNWVRKQHKTK